MAYREKNTLNIRFLFGITQTTFNVDSKGQKMFWDPVFQKSYGYASANNIKHNVKETFIIESGEELPQKIYEKKYGDSSNGKQGAMWQFIDFTTASPALFGLWNSKETTAKDKRFVAISQQAGCHFSHMVPIHTLLSKFDSTDGVNRGNSVNSSIYFKGKDDAKYFTPEELAKGEKISIEEAIEEFKETPSNFFPLPTEVSGIYQQITTVDLDTFAMFDLSNNPNLIDEEIKEALNNGYRKVVINEKEWLAPPKEKRIEAFKYFIEALFEWDFTSNNSVGNLPKELLRVDVSLNKGNKFLQATFAEVKTKQVNNKEEREVAELVLNDDINGVYSYNTLLLKKYYNTCNNSNIKTDINADDNAKEKLLELGCNFLEQQEQKLTD